MATTTTTTTTTTPTVEQFRACWNGVVCPCGGVKRVRRLLCSACYLRLTRAERVLIGGGALVRELPLALGRVLARLKVAPVWGDARVQRLVEEERAKGDKAREQERERERFSAERVMGEITQ
jgi:hypothetical protein